MFLTNFHTHTNFCDGNNTAEEMILSAIQKNIKILGFSSHAAFPFSTSWHINIDQIQTYVEQIRSLAQKYQDKIKILCGFEADFIEGITIPSKENYKDFKPDFLIGSVHFLVTKNGHFEIDDSAQNVKNGIEEYFNKNAKIAVCQYFETQKQMLKKGDFEILGHPDLFRKRNKILNLFDENDFWYKNQIKNLVKEIKKSQVIVEINTGAIARGAMDSLYPNDYFLDLLFQNKIPITINSDAHDANQIACAFDFALNKAKKIGFTELAYIDEDCKIKFQKI